MAPARIWAPLIGLALWQGGLVAIQGAGPAPAPALELRGSTFFVKPPWKVDLVSFYTNVWTPNVEYYFTVELDPQAGASLGGLQIEQTRGVDRRFPFFVERSRAFLGRPRAEGAPVPVQASFDPNLRRFTLTFPEPVPPGSTLTVVLLPWNNPGQSDTYLFEVTAFPAGPNPSPTPLGFGTLRIYDPNMLW